MATIDELLIAKGILTVKATVATEIRGKLSKLKVGEMTEVTTKRTNNPVIYRIATECNITIEIRWVKGTFTYYGLSEGLI